MVDQLNRFAGEVTRVAREVGTEGQARRPGAGVGRRRHLEGPDRQRQLDGVEPDRAGAQHRRGRDRGGAGRSVEEDHRQRVSGEILQLKETINTMVDQLNAFAGEVTRVAREVGTEGRLGGQAQVPGVAGTWKDLTDSVNSMAVEPDRPGAQHRRGGDRDRQRRSVAQDHRRCARRDPSAEGNAEHDGGSAQPLRRRGDARGARGRHRRAARRPGAGAGCRRHVEGPDRQRQLDGVEPDGPGAQHRRGDDRGGARRPRRARSPST